jgi:hypothetical protein
MTPACSHAQLFLRQLMCASLLVCAGGIRPSASQSRDMVTPTSGLATVEGTVVTDDPSARPLGRATVTLTGVVPYFSRMTSTDPQGRFAFPNLPAGDVIVTAAKGAYLTTYYGSRRPGRGPAVPFAVGSAARTTISITIRLLRGGVIAGTVLGVTGRPQPGVQVAALQPRTVDGQPSLATSGDNQGGLTDDLGRYRIWGLTPGDYVISAMPPAALSTVRSITDADLQWGAEELLRGPGGGGAGPPFPRALDEGRVVSYAPVYYPGVVDPARAATVTVDPAAEQDGVDLALQIVPAATISGTLIGLDGEAVPSAPVILGRVSTLRAQGSASVRTDASGHFVFRAVMPGDFTVAARASSHGPAAGVPPPPLGPDLWASIDLTVSGEDQSGLVLALRPGMTVAGHLAFDGSSQPPEDLSRALINLTVTGANASGATASQTRALADGAFALPAVAPGRYRLSAAIVGRPQASGRSQASWFLASVMRDGQDLLDSALEVTPGQDVKDLSVVFSDRQTDLAGTLVDTGNHPVAGYVVLVFPTDRRFWTSTSRRIRQALLGADGHFDISGLPAGEYFLGAVTHADADDVSDVAFLEEVAAAALRTTLAAGEHRVQDIRLGGK